MNKIIKAVKNCDFTNIGVCKHANNVYFRASVNDLLGTNQLMID